tara:strand:- start:1455 stop:1580 length:126 start_codon:yes stop_codon:yes gene_type:complete
MFQGKTRSKVTNGKLQRHSAEIGQEWYRQRTQQAGQFQQAG